MKTEDDTPQQREPLSGEDSNDLTRVLKVFASIVAPTTALTALMYFFGLLHAYWFLQTFGVDYTIMGFSTQDYLTRSADGLFVPLTVVAGIVVAAIWVGGPLSSRVSSERRSAFIRVGTSIALAVGILLISIAIIGVIAPHAVQGLVAVPGLALACGVLSLTAAARTNLVKRLSKGGAPLSAPTMFAQWSAIFCLVTVGLFWAAADYSAAVGSRRGAEVVEALHVWPDVVVYSERDLNLSAPGVVKKVCGDSKAAYRYRYGGLKLILQSGGQYLFLPEQWTWNGSVAFVVPQTDALRLDFAAAGVAPVGAC